MKNLAQYLTEHFYDPQYDDKSEAFKYQALIRLKEPYFIWDIYELEDLGDNQCRGMYGHTVDEIKDMLAAGVKDGLLVQDDSVYSIKKGVFAWNDGSNSYCVNISLTKSKADGLSRKEKLTIPTFVDAEYEIMDYASVVRE